MYFISLDEILIIFCSTCHLDIARFVVARIIQCPLVQCIVCHTLIDADEIMTESSASIRVRDAIVHLEALEACN